MVLAASPRGYNGSTPRLADFGGIVWMLGAARASDLMEAWWRRRRVHDALDIWDSPFYLHEALWSPTGYVARAYRANRLMDAVRRGRRVAGCPVTALEP